MTLSDSLRFLLAEFQLEYVLRKHDPRLMNDSLSSLPSTVHSAYENIIHRITESGPESEEVAWRILTWIFRCARPLKIFELQEALSVRQGDSELFPQYFMSPDDITERCESLVIYDTERDVIRFTHYSVYEFLNANCIDKLLPTYLAMTCLTYLQFNEFEEPCTSKDSLEQRLERCKLSGYVSQYWAHHARDVECEIQDKVLGTFQSHKKRESMYQMRRFVEIRWEPFVPPEMGLSLLHILCENGLNFVCGEFIRRGFDFDDLYVFTLPSTN